MQAHPDPAAALAALRADGVDYLLVNEANICYRLCFDPDDRLEQSKAAFERLTPSLERIYADGTPERPSIIIYRVPPDGAR